jgi:hypothetical protein
MKRADGEAEACDRGWTDVTYANLKSLLGRELTDAELGVVVTAKVTGDRRLLWSMLRDARERPSWRPEESGEPTQFEAA